MKKTPWNPMTITCAFASLAVCVFAPLQAQETETTLRWKNGDGLSGEMLESGPGQIRWSSPLFSDEMVLDIGALESITFPTQSATEATGTFRVGTVSGDVFTAELIGSDENTLRFSSNRYGDFSVNRNSIYSLDRRENPNLIFDGSQLPKSDFVRNGPIKDLTYKIYQGRAIANPKFFDLLEASAEGHFSAGWLDVELSPFEDSFGIVFEGKIEAKTAGAYSFEVSSDDGSRLLIDGKEVTRIRFGDQVHQPQGRITLDAGFHSIRVEYYEGGGEEHLRVWWEGPDLPRSPLFGTNPGSHWSQGPGGHATSDMLGAEIFHDVELPKQFELDVEFAASESPQFLLAITKEESSAASDDTFRLETWGNELVAVQGAVFEPLVTLDDGRNDVHLRLAFDANASTLEVFDSNGLSLVTLEGIQPTTGTSGILVRNRGSDLTIRRLSVYRQSADGAPQTVDSSKARVHLIDGQVLYGRLHVEADGAYILDQDGTRQDINLSQLDRIATPNVELLANSSAAELNYADGAVILGQVERTNSDHVVLHTTFSDTPLTCMLTGATVLQFTPASSEAEPLSSDSDQLLSASGSLRGHLSFDRTNSPLSWKPEGAEKPLQLAIIGGARIERSPESLSQTTYDENEFPFVLHLKNGEIIPCDLSSYNEETLDIKSPFIKGRQIKTAHIKAIVFKPLEAPDLNKEPLSELDQWLKEFIAPVEEAGLSEERVKLDRALTVPRFNRDSPPSHILMANNGDLKRGKLLAINGNSIQFESKLRKLNVPIDRIAQVVSVSDPDAEEDEEEEEESEALPLMPEGAIRAALADGSVLVFEPIESRDGKLWGLSPIYGEMSVPLKSIRDLSIGDFEIEKFESLFREWVVRPGKEPEFGELTGP